MSFSVGLDVSALDPNFKEHALRGIGRYVLELQRYFERLKGGPVSVGTFDHNEFRSPDLVNRVIDSLPFGRNTVRQQMVYPLRLGVGKTSAFEVLHFPAHMDAPSWGTKRFIVTVLDLIPLLFKDLYTADRLGWRFHLARWLEMRAIRSASLILAISENTARDVHRILGIPEERIVVTPLGVDDRFFNAGLREDEVIVRDRYGIPRDRRIVLYVGGIDPRKNYRVMCQTHSEVVGAFRERGQKPPVLVMSGKIRQDREFIKLREEIQRLKLDEDVCLPGFVNDTDLLQVYGMTSVFFFPSLYEGFGLPPLEALAAGVPVVSSNASAMPEVLGDTALLVEPTNVRGFARAIIDILDNPELARDLKERGRVRARLFPWSKTGDMTLSAYGRLAGGAHVG